MASSSFPQQKTFKSNFSYALYNNNSLNNEINFQYRIKEQPPKDFLLVYFDGGTRNGTNNVYNLDNLTQLGNGASNLYFFGAITNLMSQNQLLLLLKIII
ncbi:hypothetical protein [Paulownia witches'-broom phytoplasma]|uniref:hypothetical protein n=1 Tax=Paulownia witches'-broom phytoplasma TaxID=39647 RepID=UPI001CED4CFA|nr:hypothetical protein [Paulownia witches'-broom phytoplasma]GLH60992.1 hypothetical protein PAWBP_7300 [Paulownia witches'-broom phytoplasma]